MAITSPDGDLLVLILSRNGIDSVADKLRDLSFVSNRISFSPVRLY